MSMVNGFMGGPDIRVKTTETSMQTLNSRPLRLGGILRTGAVLVIALTLMLLTAAGPAHADFGLSGFSATLHDPGGAAVTQAGSHPDLTVQYTVNQAANPGGGTAFDDGQTREVVVNLPKGLYGDPEAVPQCPRELLVGALTSFCPPDSQVGTLGLQGSPDPTQPQYLIVPLFNVIPGQGEAAAFGFDLLGSPVGIVSTVSSQGQPAIQATLHNVSQGLTYYGTKMVLWGVPADPAHDPDRVNPGTASGAPTKAFLTAPSDCSRPMTTRIRASSWQAPDHWVEATDIEPAPTGCDRLRLTHSVSVQPTDHRADQPSGYDIGLNVPQNDAANGLGTPPLRRVQVDLPDGVSLSPSSAAGLAGCTDAALAVGTDTDATCPDASKVGDVTITTPLLPKDLAGTVYVGAPTPDAMFRLFMVVKGPGVLLKLRGTVHPDPITGRLTAVFDDLPELPFSSMHMHLNGGPGASLANPASCGTKTATSQVTAWAGAQSSGSDSFTINSDARGAACPAVAPFSPSFDAGIVVPTAGASSPFTMTIRRRDGDQELSGVSVTLPPGVLGNLSGIPRCPDAAASAGSCDAASQVGTTTTESGAGERPLPLTGKAFLGGPYKGAPFSLVITVPAQAGPYDLGTVVVRATLSIDPVDAHVTVRSDPLPTILDGVPLRLRTINVVMNRPGFMVSPTSCDPMQITGQITSLLGTLADVRDRFQVGGCPALGLKPKLAMTLTGRGQTTDGKHPALSALLTMPGVRQTNLKKVTVTLPLSVALDTDNSQSDSLCEFVAGQKTIPDCPAASIVGTATARTPILDQPLSGPLYFIKNVRIDPKSHRQIRTLPTLATVLQGEGVTLVVRASTAAVHDRLVTTFSNVPDAPVSSFQLNINGGKKDILVVSDADVCKSTQVAEQVATGQNGKTDRQDVTIATPACGLKVLTKKVSSKAVTLKVAGLGAGKLTVSGKHIRRASRTIATATVATIVARRTGGARPASVKVSFLPAGSKKARTVTASLKATTKRRTGPKQ